MRITKRERGRVQYPDESALVAAAQSGDGVALESLILRHRPFVLRLARASFNGALGIDDLVQEGLIGLLEGIQRFDSAHPRGATLLGYSRRWIERAMKRANQRADVRYGGSRIPEDLYWAAGRLARAERVLGPNADDREVAAAARVTSGDAERLAPVRARRLARLSVETKGSSGDAGQGVDLDLVADLSAVSALDQILSDEQRRLARAAFAALPAPTRKTLLAALSHASVQRGRGTGAVTGSRERERAVAALRESYAIVERNGLHKGSARRG